MSGRQVHALAFDPLDQRRLAFQLGASFHGRCCEASRPLAACGWSGVLDLTSLAITHIHCPEPPWRVEVRLTASYCCGAGSEASDRASAARSCSGPSRIALAGRLTVHSFAAVRMHASACLRLRGVTASLSPRRLAQPARLSARPGGHLPHRAAGVRADVRACAPMLPMHERAGGAADVTLCHFNRRAPLLRRHRVWRAGRRAPDPCSRTAPIRRRRGLRM